MKGFAPYLEKSLETWRKCCEILFFFVFLSRAIFLEIDPEKVLGHSPPLNFCRGRPCSGQYRYCPQHTGTSQIVPVLPRAYRYYPEYTGTVQSILVLSKAYRYCPGVSSSRLYHFWWKWLAPPHILSILPWDVFVTFPKLFKMF